MKITSNQLKRLSKEDEMLGFMYVSEHMRFGSATSEKEQDSARELFLSFSQFAFSLHYEFSTGKREKFTKINDDIYYYENNSNNTLTIIKEGIGCVYAHLLGNNDKAYRLECLEVVEDQRNKGYGKELLKIFMDIAKEKDVIGISTIASNQHEGWRSYTDSLDKLQAFYEEFGFKREEWRRMFYVYPGKEGKFHELQELNELYERSIGYTPQQVKNMMKHEEEMRKLAKENGDLPLGRSSEEDKAKKRKLEEEKKKKKAKRKAAKKQKRK